MSYKLMKDMSEDDIHQWLNDGWVRHIDYGAIQFYGDVDIYENTARFLVQGDPISVDLDDIECYWPVCGMVNRTRGNLRAAVYVKRNQRRQWRRTFNSMVCTASLIGRWGVTKQLGQQAARNICHFGTPMVTELFDPTYYSPAMAMRMIREEGCMSVAVTPQLAIAGDRKGNFAVYYRETIVGSIRNGEYTPTVVGHHSALAEQLVKEALNEDD